MSSSLNREVGIAIVATFVCTLVLAAILFLLYDKFAKRRLRNKIDTSFGREAVISHEGFRKSGSQVKGLIVEENGRNVIYVKDLEDKQLKTKFSNVVLNPSFESEEMKEDTVKRTRAFKSQEVKDQVTESAQPNAHSMGASPSVPNPAPLFPTSSLPEAPPAPPPPPPPPASIRAKRHSGPPPKGGGLVSSLKPPIAPRWNTNNKSGAFCSADMTSKGTEASYMKLKPLHWDKVMANADHSMVWNEIIDGSLRFDDNQMETLFGYTNSSNKTWQGNGVSSSPSPASNAQTFILEARKSQNSAIVLKSVGVSRSEILDSLLEGHGLATDVLEKLTRIAPTQEETAKILQFKGNPSELATAESFLHHILKAVPSAFIRINAMLFRSNYDAEILHLKKSLQALELGCKELRTRGLFLKLLEAILKAGNRMNAGTSRGNAQGFNLTTLRKISDVKSNDGKTTLLHFVVEQVARSEGRRCMLNQNRSDQRTEAQRTEEDPRLSLGLQAVKGLNVEFTNVKKAATMDYDNLINTISCLKTQISKTRVLVTRCGNGDGFAREMKGFLEETEEEIKVVAEEQTRILELVKKTTDYYQAGGKKQDKANLLELFVIVKDFLDMVNRVSADISQKMQTKNLAASTGSTSPPLPLPTRSPFKFHHMHSHWASESSSESEDDFQG